MKKIQKLTDKNVQSISSFANAVCVSACSSGYTCPDCSQCFGNTSLLQTRRDNASAAVNSAYESKRNQLSY